MRTGEYGSINYVSFINFYFVRELFFEIGVYRELIIRQMRMRKILFTYIVCTFLF